MAIFPAEPQHEQRTHTPDDSPSDEVVRNRSVVPRLDRSTPAPIPRRRLWPRLVAGFLIAGLAGGAAWLYLDQPVEDERRLVLQGNIDVRQVNLAFKVGGRVETLAVDEGDLV